MKAAIDRLAGCQGQTVRIVSGKGCPGGDRARSPWAGKKRPSVCLGREGEKMIDEEYRGYNLTAVRHSGIWQVSIYPLSVGQIVPKPRGRRAAQAVAREDAFIEARRRVDALLAGDAA